MCGPIPLDIPEGTTQTSQIDVSFGFVWSSPISVAGTLDVTDADAILVTASGGGVESITNTGTINASIGDYGINNTGVINKIVNAQGIGNNDGALTYTGVLPTRYEVIIKSTTSYGVLAAKSTTQPTAGPMEFGIYGGGMQGVAP